MKFLLRLSAILLCLSAGSALAADVPDRYDIDRVLGKADAPLTIIEYASLTCSHCAAFHKSVLPKLKAEWIETGKAKLIYRDFPTNPQALSVGGALVTQCVAEDRYFGLLAMLMENQEAWLSAPNPQTVLKTYARLAGLPGDKVDACLNNQALADAIIKRAEDAYRGYKISGTPSFVINGKVMGGFQNYADLDAALKAAKP